MSTRNSAGKEDPPPLSFESGVPGVLEIDDELVVVAAPTASLVVASQLAKVAGARVTALLAGGETFPVR